MASMIQSPTLYEYYADNSPTSGLSTELDINPYFKLNSRNITILSGAIHYFRVPPEYWRDRLRKLRATGFNTVETYVPWNLYEPYGPSSRNSSNCSNFKDLETFLRTAQEEDLLAIVRPGPYICAEWELGGLPSWLLNSNFNPDTKLRSSSPSFMKHVANYFARLLPVLVALQFTKGGPIVAFQIENEYGSTEVKRGAPVDKLYLKELRDMIVKAGVVELLFTSDSPDQHGNAGSIEGVLQTANFARNTKKEFEKLKQLQPGKPVMAMEFWTGWFDHWGEKHHVRDNLEFAEVLRGILKYPASVNLYMFHGGTSFGFYNGANIDAKGNYQPDVTSYDYDAPLSEAGDYTEKYHIMKRLVTEVFPDAPKLRLPSPPPETPKTKYTDVVVSHALNLKRLVESLPRKIVSGQLLSMEYLNGTGLGYVVYRKEFPRSQFQGVLEVKAPVRDVAILMVDGAILDSFTWASNNNIIRLPNFMDSKSNGTLTLEILAANLGRNNFGKLSQLEDQIKGLKEGDVMLNGDKVENWEIFPVEFERSWLESLTWGGDKKSEESCRNNNAAPALYRATLELSAEPKDTFLDMRNWEMGIVFVNHFNLGRYWNIGPLRGLYLPASILKKGTNEIFIFEHFHPGKNVEFSTTPLYNTGVSTVSG